MTFVKTKPLVAGLIMSALTAFPALAQSAADNKLYEAAPRTGEGPNEKANSSVEESNKRLRTDLTLSTCTRCGETLKVED